ncbi:hypothetical protein Pmani_013271 [Petrolisthes manimaculis]|uniref:Uncharacterized protein n=1 Tax=Petrolisthes manimaculis TaxID=1843537 RepID=A0AAE1PVA7_9EUCA|nr:hypothetical protein Pmani_013271 [Petrolisthes manimaculis]
MTKSKEAQQLSSQGVLPHFHSRKIIPNPDQNLQEQNPSQRTEKQVEEDSSEHEGKSEMMRVVDFWKKLDNPEEEKITKKTDAQIYFPPIK